MELQETKHPFALLEGPNVSVVFHWHDGMWFSKKTDISGPLVNYAEQKLCLSSKMTSTHNSVQGKKTLISYPVTPSKGYNVACCSKVTEDVFKVFNVLWFLRQWTQKTGTNVVRGSESFKTPGLPLLVLTRPPAHKDNNCLLLLHSIGIVTDSNQTKFLLKSTVALKVLLISKIFVIKKEMLEPASIMTFDSLLSKKIRQAFWTCLNH